LRKTKAFKKYYQRFNFEFIPYSSKIRIRGICAFTGFGLKDKIGQAERLSLFLEVCIFGKMNCLL
jgi:hypothetical protein